MHGAPSPILCGTGRPPWRDDRRQESGLPAGKRSTPEEIRELTIFWLTIAESHLDLFTIYSGHKRFADSGFLGMETQWDLARSLKGLLATTTGPDRLVCFLTTFSEAYRRHEPMPKLSGPEWEAVRHCLAPAVNALLAEALARFGVVREDLRRERSSSGEPG